jgi:hypothetical protein
MRLLRQMHIALKERESCNKMIKNRLGVDYDYIN